jgi:hypothetical protein
MYKRNNTVIRCISIIVLLFLLCPDAYQTGIASSPDPAQQIVAVSEKMLHVFEGLGEFSCDVEVRYYRAAKEDKTYCFTWFQGQNDSTRIRFSSPYRGLAAAYRRGDADVTIQPFAFMPFITFKLSLYHSLLRTPSGQRMDHASIAYLSRFFYNNIHVIQQHECSVLDGTDRVALAFWAEDYTGREGLNKYKVTVSTDNCFPMQIERYNRNDEPIEVIIFKAFVVHGVQRETTDR